MSAAGLCGRVLRGPNSRAVVLVLGEEAGRWRLLLLDAGRSVGEFREGEELRWRPTEAELSGWARVA